MGVGRTPPWARANSALPSTVRKRARPLLAAGWLIPRRSAATLTLPQS